MGRRGATGIRESTVEVLVAGRLLLTEVDGTPTSKRGSRPSLATSTHWGNAYEAEEKYKFAR